MTFTVGFDLDMTLIDPRPGMLALFDRLAFETSVPLDGQAFVSRLGPPLQDEFSRYGLDPTAVQELIARFRELYQDIVIPATTALPGAVDALAAVRLHGGTAIVVTAKLGRHGEMHLAELGLDVDLVIGELWSSAKGAALAECGAEIYVGDHLGDIRGARAADALAVAVATGPISASELAAAGADVVLPDLTHFGSWLNSYLLATVH